jgi:CIC family chloride channel protein
MTSDVQTIPRTATLADVEETFRRTRHSAYPVVDDAGELVGIVSRDDLLEPDDLSTPVMTIASSEVITIRADDDLQTALSRMIEEAVDHLPVVDHSRLIGICTRTDVLQARMRQLDNEQAEHGWLKRRR